MPISLLVKHYLNFSDNIYLSEITVYLFVLLAIYGWFMEQRRIQLKNLIDTRVILFLGFTVLMQFVSMFISYHRYASEGYNIAPTRSIISLSIFIFFVFFHFFIVKYLINSEKDIKYFLKGSYVSTLILLTVTYSQQLFLLFPKTYVLQQLMKFWGTFFESKNPDKELWFTSGSYVQTLGRINGFFTESAMLAAQIAIICLPFVLSAIKNQCNIFSNEQKYSSVKYHILLILLLGMLLLAKTSTGILAIVLSLLIFWLLLPLKRKISYSIFIAAIVVITICLYFSNTYINGIFNAYVFGKTDSYSTDNRLGNTIGLLLTFLHNPFGVGSGYTYHYLLEYTPAWTTHNDEYSAYVNYFHSIPILSIFSGWLAQYGLLIVGLFIGYIIRLEREIYKLIRKQIDSPSYTLYKTIGDSSLIFFLILFPLSFFNFGWNETSFLVMFFFFVVFRQHLFKKIYGYPHVAFEKINYGNIIKWLFNGSIRRRL
jgi:hypothetical protein